MDFYINSKFLSGLRDIRVKANNIFTYIATPRAGGCCSKPDLNVVWRHGGALKKLITQIVLLNKGRDSSVE